MPINIPNIPATAAPIKRAAKNLSPSGMAPSMHFEKNAPENAPTHINPACPRLSSPKMPTVRFREIANIT